MEGVIIASGHSEVQIAKCDITVSVCILDGTDTRASGIAGYCPHLLKYLDI